MCVPGARDIEIEKVGGLGVEKVSSGNKQTRESISKRVGWGFEFGVYCDFKTVRMKPQGLVEK